MLEGFKMAIGKNKEGMEVKGYSDASPKYGDVAAHGSADISGAKKNIIWNKPKLIALLTRKRCLYSLIQNFYLSAAQILIAPVKGVRVLVTVSKITSVLVEEIIDYLKIILIKILRIHNI